MSLDDLLTGACRTFARWRHGARNGALCFGAAAAIYAGQLALRAAEVNAQDVTIRNCEAVVPLPLPIGPSLRVRTHLAARRVPVSANSLDMRVVAEIEGEMGGNIVLGDTDRDGQNEIIILPAGLSCNYRIFEEQGDNVYSVEYTGGCLLPYAVGDLDGDGKSELIGQNGGFVQVYESVDAISYPTELVWSSEYLSNVDGDTVIGDTDRDGRMEIIHSQNYLGSASPSVLLIFENVGDNAFTLAFSDTIYDTGATGEKAITDLDGDGFLEIAFSGFYGRLYVYESPADDTWQRVWRDSSFGGLYGAYAVSVGTDTDGNGRDELFVMGIRLAVVPETWTTRVYEAPGDNVFEEVATFSIADGYTGAPYNATVNLDQLGRQEYVMDTKAGLWIYRATAPGQWDLVHQIADSTQYKGHAGVYGFDVNRNGIPELIWGGGPTSILEHWSGAADIGDNLTPRPGSLTAFPNPCRVQAQLRLARASEAATQLGVFDVAGRLVERRLLIREPQGPILWGTEHLPSGVYWLRLEDTSGQALAAGRVTVMR